MKVILSPAKTMNFKPLHRECESTIPLFEEEASHLASIMDKPTPHQLARLLKVNDQIAEKTWQMYQNFNVADNPRKQAAFAFNGIAYGGLDFESMSDECVEFAQEHLRILSGLYGMLRPLDLIQPYRLDVADKIDTGDGSLYHFWMKKVTSHLLGEEKCLINLASEEYFKMINTDSLPVSTRIISPVFMEMRDRKYKVIVTASKRARGLMARYIIDNKITKPEDLMSFNMEGYVFYPEFSRPESDISEWVFVKE